MMILDSNSVCLNLKFMSNCTLRMELTGRLFRFLLSHLIGQPGNILLLFLGGGLFILSSITTQQASHNFDRIEGEKYIKSSSKNLVLFRHTILLANKIFNI